MALIKCVCISTERKTSAKNIHECQAALDGLAGDVHQGKSPRQISMLPMEAVSSYFAEEGGSIQYGRFGENLVIDGLDWDSLQIGEHLRAGNVRLEIIRLGAGGPRSDSYKGKKICDPMQKSFIFCKILQEGMLREGMEIMKEEKDKNEMH